MYIVAVTFWICLFLIFYTYVFYPSVLFIAYTFVQLRRDIDYLTTRRNRRTLSPVTEELPAVSMIVPAYNEEEHLEAKLANLRDTDYPRENLQVIFVSDGSTDRTQQILSGLNEPGIDVIFKKREGKASALNRAIENARNPILIFSDGSTLFEPDALRMLVRHFNRPDVGVVCGSLKFAASEESQQTEGIYWKYESIIRLMESRLGATLTASGAIYALRREAWSPLSSDAILDDFIIPVNARKQGYRVIYDPEAIALEFASSSVKGEFARRVRLAMGSFRSLPEFLRAPLPGFTRFAFLSHKLMRWVVPFLVPLILVTSIILSYERSYQLFFALQMAFYVWAATGFFFQRHLRRVRFALVGYFLLAMNLAFLVGMYRCLTGRKGAVWQRVS